MRKQAVVAEALGAFFILAAIVMGIVGSTLAQAGLADAVRAVGEPSRVETSEGLKSTLDRLSADISSAMDNMTLAHVGFWMFLAGLATFVYGARSRCLAAIESGLASTTVVPVDRVADAGPAPGRNPGGS